MRINTSTHRLMESQRNHIPHLKVFDIGLSVFDMISNFSDDPLI